MKRKCNTSAGEWVGKFRFHRCGGVGGKTMFNTGVGRWVKTKFD